MKKIISLFTISFCMLTSVYAMTLRVEQLHGADFALAVQKIGKLIINGTTLEFYDRQGSLLYTSDVESVGAMTFDEYSQGLETVLSDGADKYVVYPNPTTTTLLVKGLEQNVPLRLYSMDGQLVKSVVGTSMGVAELPNGHYLLQCENQIIKVIKQ